MKRADTLRALERAAMRWYELVKYDPPSRGVPRWRVFRAAERHAARLKAKRRGRKS